MLDQLLFSVLELTGIGLILCQSAFLSHLAGGVVSEISGLRLALFDSQLALAAQGAG